MKGKLEKLIQGNKLYLKAGGPGDVSAATAGQIQTNNKTSEGKKTQEARNSIVSLVRQNIPEGVEAKNNLVAFALSGRSTQSTANLGLVDQALTDLGQISWSFSTFNL